MTSNRSERLVNLLILLLVARTFVSKERIREMVEDYRDAPTTEAFERMFERDKDELRALGIPVETGHLDAYFSDEPGYRVVRDAFELPEISLDPDEAAVVGLAARVWQHAGMAEATSRALLKLSAAGVATDRSAIDVVQPRLTADEPAFDTMWGACQTRTPVTFSYRRGNQPTAHPRHLQPWGMVSARSRWYVVGFDTDRGEPRLFRLSRIEGEVDPDGSEGTFTVPEGTDVRALADRLSPERPVGRASLLARPGAGHELRSRALSVSPVTEGAWEGWDRIEVEYADLDTFTADVLASLDAVVALDPPELRAEVQARLEALIAPVGGRG